MNFDRYREKDTGIRYLLAAILISGAIGVAGGQTATWRSTTNSNRWVDKGTLSAAAWISTATCLELFPDTLYQAIEGFGGCFGEKAWNAIVKLNAPKQDTVLRALFDTSGCNFNNCRMPIGANDFANDTSYYSLNDSSGDYAMHYFNLRRDSLRLIPFIKAAQAYQPELTLWASPWTPPAWMKTTKLYFNAGTLVQDSLTCSAYALYLEKAVNAFRAIGIDITVLAVQNEPTQGNGQAYPSCVWSATQYANFYRNYLIPRFRKDSVKVDLMWGTFCGKDSLTWIITPMSDTALQNNISVFGLQHTKKAWSPFLYSRYPGKRIYETETDCCHNNDWAGAVIEFNLLATFLNTGTAQYSEWNMVLDQSGLSGWNWKQASMITVDTTAKTITYNPAFYAVKHWTHYIRRNARRIKSVNSDPAHKGSVSAYRNPNGDIVLLVGNEAAAVDTLSVKLGSKAFKAVLPATSMNTFVISQSVSISNSAPANKALSPVLGLRMKNSTLTFSVSPKARLQGISFTLCDLRGRVVWSGSRNAADLNPGAVHSIAVKSGQRRIPDGCYLLSMTVNSAGVTTRFEKRISSGF